MSQIASSTETANTFELKYYERKPDSVYRTSYSVYLEPGQDGYIIAKCPELNVVTQGKTEDEALKNSLDAMTLMVEELGKDKDFTIIPRRKLSV